MPTMQKLAGRELLGPISPQQGAGGVTLSLCLQLYSSPLFFIMNGKSHLPRRLPPSPSFSFSTLCYQTYTRETHKGISQERVFSSQEPGCTMGVEKSSSPSPTSWREVRQRIRTPPCSPQPGGPILLPLTYPWVRLFLERMSLFWVEGPSLSPSTFSSISLCAESQSWKFCFCQSYILWRLRGAGGDTIHLPCTLLLSFLFPSASESSPRS